MTNLERLYGEIIRKHAANPAGFRKVISATHRHEEYNAQCGDRIEFRARIKDDLIEAAAFDGEACTICMASASMLCGLAEGMNTRNWNELRSELYGALKGKPLTSADTDLPALLAVRRYPARVQCATLPWKTAARALGLNDRQ